MGAPGSVEGVIAPLAAAAVFLNHFYVVPDAATYEALRQSAFLKESFAVFEARTTVRKDMTYTGIYFYGDHTYFEFLPPGPGFAEQSTGLAFGVEEPGAGAALAPRLQKALSVSVKDVGVTRQAEGKDVPWFRMIAADREDDKKPLTTWVMEYETSFLDQWYPTLPPKAHGIARGAVLDRYVAMVGPADARASRRLEDVIAIHVALGPKDRSAFLTQCRVFGYAVEENAEGSTCVGPGVRFILVPGDSGIVGFDLKLRGPVDPPVEHRLGQSVLRLGPGRAATWSFPPAPAPAP
jgi:Family of unknown function (DUF5829)